MNKRGRQEKLTPEMKEEALGLKRSGFSYRRIQNHFEDLGYSICYNTIRRGVLKVANPGEVLPNMAGRPRGHRLSPETRRKISAAHKGRIGYWRGKVGPNKGRIMPAKTRKKISEGVTRFHEKRAI